MAHTEADESEEDSPESIGMDHDHAEAFLEFAWANHPKNSTGWVGGLGEAIVDVETRVYDETVALDRKPLEALSEWGREACAAPETDPSSTVEGAFREIDLRLADFGTPRVSIDSRAVEAAVAFAREHTDVLGEELGAEIRENAIEQLEAAI